ncbi:eukaryotic translation initiation factor 4 gamma 1 isoform X2 [Aplysia californica]|uniref:Eukaryotic translation initiation factor 4 gamma 1 isoform X2 n=1 Tax=Aplysia californica TaxID=6500 RepID=A0ABM0JTJ6_APLCA|nr:eukaryotic translation initiation factor 4 gamma 1 isoform X2 [Aplysia californica]
MTSRGNSSISPPVQISVQSQPRQVNALPSGTPPPQQQFYAGQTQLPQGVFEYQQTPAQQQGQQLLSYQAYGSAPNDIRVSGGSGRGAAPQQGLVQGGAFYQQAGQTMRPQQNPQNQPPYYISTPNNLRQRPPQPVLMLQPQAPGFPPGGNMVIPTQNMYHQRVPLFTPPNSYAFGGTNNCQVFFAPNGQMVRGPMPGPGSARSAPAPRERRLIEIKDPTSGRNVTEELLHGPQSADSAEQMEERPVIQGNQQVAQEFATRVAERIQTPVAGSTPMEPPQTSAPVVESNGLPSPYQQPPPPPQQGQQPPNMIRPMQHPSHMMPPGQNPMHPPHNMMPGHGQGILGQPPNSGAAPDMMPHIRPPMSEVMNLSVPPPSLPPQVRQTTPAQMFVSQQPQQPHAPSLPHGPRHPQQQQQPPQGPTQVRTQVPPPAMAPTPPPQQAAPPPPTQQQPQPLPLQQPVVPPQPAPVTPAPLLPAATPDSPAPVVAPPQPARPEPTVAKAPAAAPAVVEKKTTVEVVPPPAAENIPPKPAASAVVEKRASPAKEVSPAPAPVVAEVPPPQTNATTAKAKEQTPPPPSPAAAVKDDPPTKTEEIKDTASSGASTQGKDVRKGKKKKEINRKEISGSDMDAFIDKPDTPSPGQLESAPSGLSFTSDGSLGLENGQMSDHHSVANGVRNSPRELSGRSTSPSPDSAESSTRPAQHSAPPSRSEGERPGAGAQPMLYSKIVARSPKTPVLAPAWQRRSRTPEDTSAASSQQQALTTGTDGTDVAQEPPKVVEVVVSPANASCNNGFAEAEGVANGQTGQTNGDHVSAEEHEETPVTDPSVTDRCVTGASEPSKDSDSNDPTSEERSASPTVPDAVQENGDSRKEQKCAPTARGGSVSGTAEVEKPVAAQAESKHKLKKKKKKKGRKSPPIQKGKQGVVVDQEGKDSESVESKPPLPPSAVERQASAEKSPAARDVKPTFSYAAAATGEKAKEASARPVAQVEAPAQPVEEKKPAAVAGPDTTDNKTKAAPKVEAAPPAASVATPPPVAPAEVKPAAAPVVNQNQAPKKEQSPVPAAVEPPKPSAPAPAPAPSPAPAPAPAPTQAPAAVQASKPEPAAEPERRKEAPAPRVLEEDRPDNTRVSEEKAAEIKDTKRDINDENQPPKDTGIKPEESKKVSSLVLEEDVAKFRKDSKDKLTYDRAYLMELRGCASSQTKPEGLPNLDIILDKPVINANRGGMAGPMDFTPSFFQPGVGGQRHAPPMGKSSSRGRQRPDVPMPKIITRLSLTTDAKPLHQSEKPWKSTRGQPASGEQAEKNKSLEAETLFIMNRLTPTNFERLAGEMRKLQVKNYEDLQELVKIFFDKVTMETKFVSAYAMLCKVMSSLKVPPPPGLKETAATFRVVMLSKCQQEFEADKTIIFEDPEEKKKKIEQEMPDSTERAELIEKTLYQMKLKRLKFYGNIRFIGELFKLGMLTENIMHDCIFRLLKARDDDSLVSLCQLITTVGQNLDTEKAKARMDQYFTQMSKIADERKSRIKFTLKDAIDLRNNNWVPRKEQAGPKKIDEVHKDYEQEQARNQFLNSQPLPPRNDNQQPGSRRGSRQRQEEKPNDEGWNTVGSKSLRIDASKMRLSKQSVVDENSIQLGPGGGMSKFGMWSRGSFGGAQQPSQDDRPAPASNRFSALRDDKDRRPFERSPSRGDRDGPNRGMRQGPTAGHGRGKMMARSSQEGERRDLLASARTIVGGRSQNSSRDNSWNREDSRRHLGPRGSREADNPMTRSDISLRPNEEFRTPAPPPAKKVKEMSEEEMEHKAKTILEEYLSVRDLAEAKLCVSELAGQPRLYLVVTASINNVLEGTNTARDLTGQFFHELIKSNNITLDMYTKGLNEVLTYAEDMVIDIPMMWTYLAQMISPMVVGGSLSMAKMVGVLKPALESRCCVQLLSQCLLQMKDKLGDDAVAQMWQSSGASFSDILPAGEVDGFLKDKKLEFINKPVSAAAAAQVPTPGQPDWLKFSEEVEAMVRNSRPSDEVIAFIEKTVGKEVQNKSFIRALTTAIASSSISRPPGPMKANEDVIKTRKGILQRYIKSNQLELQALYAIQALMTKLEHPSGVISCLFDTLYDEDVISEDSCKQWEKSADPAEQEGKGVCLMQLTQFFTWLSENEEPEAAS